MGSFPWCTPMEAEVTIYKEAEAVKGFPVAGHVRTTRAGPMAIKGASPSLFFTADGVQGDAYS